MNNPFSPFTQCEALVCDLDGTIYLDNVPFAGAAEFLRKILQSGRKLFYFTNNTSKSRQTYLQKFGAMNFPAQDEYLITSADCADTYLRNNNLFPEIYLVANRDLHSEFLQRQYKCLNEEEIRNTLPKAVVLGFDTELTYQKIHTAYDFILQKVPFIATHGDILCPVSKGRFKPDIGSFISLFETATGGVRPKIVGKPYKEAVDAICLRAGLSPEKIAFVGDRLYTDMRMANQFNMIGVLVLSGETTIEMAMQSHDKPSLVVNSVNDLLPHL